MDERKKAQIEEIQAVTESEKVEEAISTNRKDGKRSQQKAPKDDSEQNQNKVSKSKSPVKKPGSKKDAKTPAKKSKPTATNDHSDDDESSWADITSVENKAKPIPKAMKAPLKVPEPKKSMFKLRAISTPNRNETILKSNVTLDQTVDISAIPVLSPPSTNRKKRSNKNVEQWPPQHVNEASFQ